MAAKRLYVGLMSGTSADAIDAALVDLAAGAVRLIGTHSGAIDAPLRQRIFALARGDDETIDALCSLDRDLGHRFADACLALLEQCCIDTRHVTAIGCHGQTLRHRPPTDSQPGYTLQIGDANIIAERTGITTVADFRRRDLAAGGEGAPLVPPFHAEAFGREGARRAIVNIGGIANVTLLDGRRVVAGFDCGPGNTLLDAWYARHRSGRYDAGGAWAAAHTADRALLDRLCQDPYLQRRGPRSTGPEYFNLEWLDAQLGDKADPGTVQATLVAFTAHSIVSSLPTGGEAPTAVYLCGGGAKNPPLRHLIAERLTPMGITLSDTGELGIDPDWVEAAAFAWLARQRLEGASGNAPVVTGASGERLLGAVYPGQ